MADWKKITRQRNIHERRYFRKFRIALNKLMQPILDMIANNEFMSVEEVDYAMELIMLDGNSIRKVFDLMYEDIGLYWIDKIDILVQKDLFTEEDWYKLLMQTVEKEVAERIVSIVTTSRSKAKQLIKQEIAAGLERGESISQITKRIKRVVPIAMRKSNKFRALTIALTEVGTVQSQASFIGAKNLDIELIKIWNTAPIGLAKTERHNLMGVNGQERRMDEYFDIGGEKLRFPGDPAGSAENTINCNCVLTYKSAIIEPVIN